MKTILYAFIKLECDTTEGGQEFNNKFGIGLLFGKEFSRISARILDLLRHLYSPVEVAESWIMSSGP